MKYLHVEYGYPARDTLLKANKAGNYESWPGLTYNNAAKSFPSVTPEDMVLHRMQHLPSALQGTPSSRSDGQMMAIQELQDVLNNWGSDMTLTNQNPLQSQAPSSPKDK